MGGRCLWIAAHPRSRGENLSWLPSETSTTGSSPLTRGKREAQAAILAWAGLIPAHAGKTWSCPWRSARPWAHPRSRGENRDLPRPVALDLGSSPLTRGKRADARLRRGPARLIPAHAGKTLDITVQGRSAEAHPRSRGENAPGETYEGTVTGSSPLTRGKRDCPGRRC